MEEQLMGIHHVTAIAGDPQINLEFYRGLLGLRLVKKTVNFDDPGTYHLYYGDETGQPGTILTFFPWPGAPQGQRGTGQITVTSFSVPEDSLGYWIDRFKSLGVQFERPRPRFDEEFVTFYDPDGLKLELVAHAGELRSYPWQDSPVNEEHAIGGIHSVTLSEADLEPTSRLLAETLNFPLLGQEGGRFRFKAGEGPTGGIVDVLSLPGEKPGRIAVGTVHHIAWRVGNFEEQQVWRQRIAESGTHVTRVLDRNYFRSIYFNEPGGTLFEIATDPPGFTFDEEVDKLGSHLMLPKWLEARRTELEQTLPQLNVPDFKEETKSVRRASDPNR